MKHTRLVAILIIALALFTVGCSGPEEKKMKFYNKGKELLEKGDYVKASLEFRNALQIDPKFPDAYYMLGLVELRKGEVRKAYGAFAKTVELDPKHYDAQIQMGNLLFMGKQIDQAMEKAEFVLKDNPTHENALLSRAAYFWPARNSIKQPRS